MDCNNHEVTFHGLCVQCGYKVVTNLNSTTNIPKLGTNLDCIGGTQWKTVKENGRLERPPVGLYSRQPKKVFYDDFRMLKWSKKLRLVLDLDETLVHTVKLRRFIPSQVRSVLRAEGNVLVEDRIVVPEVNQINFQNLKKFQGRGTCFNVCGTTYKVLLRPNLRLFLMEMSKCFDIHIFTHGTREYAENILAITKLRSFFSGIYARDRPSCARMKKDLRRLFCNRLRSVVIDDKLSVWKKRDWENVFRIQRYDGDLHDKELNDCGRFLCNLHTVFFQRGFTDIRHLLRELRNRPLKR